MLENSFKRRKIVYVVILITDKIHYSIDKKINGIDRTA